jgi:hypothetical protein
MRTTPSPHVFVNQEVRDGRDQSARNVEPFVSQSRGGMSATAIRTVGTAASERVLGLGPGRFRAALAAMVTGGATATITYRLLRDKPIVGEDKT